MSACATAAGERIDARAIGELELWCVDTRASASVLRAVEQDAALLSEWERRRAAAFADRALADEWLTKATTLGYGHRDVASLFAVLARAGDV